VAQIDANSLRRLKNLSSFDPQQLQKLSGHLVLATFNKNEIVFDQDSEAHLVYLLLSGGVRFSYLARERGPVTVGLVSKGDFFGLDALVPKARHAFRCDALEKSVVGNIDPRVFIETVLGTSFEAFVRWYIPLMLPGQQAYIHCVKGLGLDLRRRVALELLNLADRFGIAHARGRRIHVHISHEILAGLVGASRQHVTQQLNQFARERIILREGRRIIINMDKASRML
jgi:CRP/FNR family transcriptional regulator, cyclic AMP receptor protein